MDALTAMNQALEAMIDHGDAYHGHFDKYHEAIAALSAAIDQTEVIGYLDGRGRFFYASDPLMKRDHSGMTECFAAVSVAPTFRG